MVSDRDHMRHALALGRRGQGATASNPAVGCILVRNGRVVGRGWTQPSGRPHAEVVALTQAGELARGATAYVTLEPCAHYGKTGPCAVALVQAGVTRVVCCLLDPDLRVAGRGFDILRDAGVAVEQGLCADEAARDLRGFLLSRTHGRAELTLKLAMTIDGRIATASGESQWITGAEARRAVHGMRSRHDAVMVGAGTVRADDPSLTVRGLGITKQPARVVLSRKLDLPRGNALSQTARDVPVYLVHALDASDEAKDYWQGTGAHLLEVSLDGQRIDLTCTLKALAEAGLNRVFCEGGGQLAASLLQAELVDTLEVFTAGCAMGAEGQPGLGALGIEELAQAPRMSLKKHQKIGVDVLTTWERAPQQ